MTTAITSPDDLLTRSQAAEVLGVSSGTLAVWASTRRYPLPYIKIGRSVRYRRSDIQAWVESRTVGPVALVEAGV